MQHFIYWFNVHDISDIYSLSEGTFPPHTLTATSLRCRTHMKYIRAQRHPQREFKREIVRKKEEWGKKKKNSSFKVCQWRVNDVEHVWSSQSILPDTILLPSARIISPLSTKVFRMQVTFVGALSASSITRMCPIFTALTLKTAHFYFIIYPIKSRLHYQSLS